MSAAQETGSHAAEAADHAGAAAGGIAAKVEAFQHYLLHHVADSHEWHLPFLHIHLPGFLSVHTMMLLLGGLFLVLLFGVAYKKNDHVPTGLTNMLESFIVFVRDGIAIANLGETDGRRFTPFFCSLFFFILMLNLMGLIPLFSTATSNVGVTTALALITFFIMVIGGIKRHGPVGYFKTFAAPGVPLPILIILVPIEILGVVIKTFALTIRLFANMLAGHIVLFALLGMIILFGAFVAPLAALLAIAIYFLEIFVAFLQAYIFTLLTAMFVGATLHPEH